MSYDLNYDPGEYEHVFDNWTMVDELCMWCITVVFMITLTTVLSPYYAYVQARSHLRRRAFRQGHRNG